MSESNCVLRLTLKKCFKAFNLENDTWPGNGPAPGRGPVVADHWTRLPVYRACLLKL